MKFRVWDKRQKQMLYDNFALSTGGMLLKLIDSTDGDYLEADEERYEVMFSTGRQADGQEVYTSDIVENDKGGIGEIVYNPVYCAFMWTPIYMQGGTYRVVEHGWKKVLGNKWQNPELLEKSDG